MMMPPATQQPYPSAEPDATIPSRPPKPSRFGLIFGIVATALTLGAIALAVFAPQLTTRPDWRRHRAGNRSTTAILATRQVCGITSAEEQGAVSHRRGWT